MVFPRSGVGPAIDDRIDVELVGGLEHEWMIFPIILGMENHPN